MDMTIFHYLIRQESSEIANGKELIKSDLPILNIDEDIWNYCLHSITWKIKP